MRSLVRALIALLLLSVPIGARQVAPQLDREAWKSMRTTLSLLKSRYCSTPEPGIALLEFTLGITISNSGTRPLVLPRGPYAMPCFVIARNESELVERRFE